MRLFYMALAAIGTAAVAQADPLRVVADIAPVHSLVAKVMGEVGAPDLLLAQSVSPHSASLRPSQARLLQEADVIVWVGPTLTPWLDRSLDNLGGDATVLTLQNAPGLTLRAPRTLAVFGEKDGHDDDHKDAHADHDDDHTHAHDHAHEGEGIDPHIWLDPENALILLDYIAGWLADLDAQHADTYRANAAQAKAVLSTHLDALSARLTPLADRPFVVYHDAFQYFETQFGLSVLGALAGSDAVAPSAARLVELRASLPATGKVCVFAEPQFDPKLITALQDSADMRSAVLDPLGSTFDLGPALYDALMDDMATQIEDCLTPKS
ncbi:MAG: zinc ABC transporter substrate-binding protein [Paracoccaceae bacterium]